VKEPIVCWWKVVWCPVAIPRHSFLLLLVFRDALVTKETMSKWGYAGDCLCPFCRGKVERELMALVFREHLFFKCSFSSYIWRELMASCLGFNLVEGWGEVARWCISALKGDSLKTRL
jgi:hypothetical protein